MRWLKGLGRYLLGFFTRRLIWIGRVLLGLFMVGMGLWFTFAPLTQQFLARPDDLQDAPLLWLIIPVGLIQLSIGYSLLRPLWHQSTDDTS